MPMITFDAAIRIDESIKLAVVDIDTDRAALTSAGR
jgi:hypothetical protein